MNDIKFTKSPDMIRGWIESQLEHGAINKDYGESILTLLISLDALKEENQRLLIKAERTDDSIREEIYAELDSYYRDQRANTVLTDKDRRLVTKVIEECQRIVIAPVKKEGE